MSTRLGLIVDDEPAVRKCLGTILLKRGIPCIEAANAIQALDLLQEVGPTSIDIIITDVEMPGGMNGVELAYAIKSTAPNIPVILMSGSPDVKVPESFPFLKKPFDVHTMLDTVDRLVSGRKVE